MSTTSRDKMKAVAVFCEGQYFSLYIHVSCCHLDVAAPAVAGAVVAETLGGGRAQDGEGVAPVHHARSVRVVLLLAPVQLRVLQ